MPSVLCRAIKTQKTLVKHGSHYRHQIEENINNVSNICAFFCVN